MLEVKEIPFAEVRFLKGENRRFFGAKKAAKERGYPDVPTYLRATGQVDEWCEEVPEEEVRMYLRAEECRREAQRLGAS